MNRWLVDGEPAGTIPVSDSAVIRGDGCFEACRSYGGVLFKLDWHLDRLRRSADALSIDLPDRTVLEDWCREVVSGGDEIVRIVVTRGDAVPGHDQPSRIIVLAHELPVRSGHVTLQPIIAPWHAAGRRSELAGAKTISYAPNLAASRSAQAAGFDDALLLGDDGTVLEGPTFSVGWVLDGRVRTPGLDLYILESITRRIVIEVAERDGLPIEEVRASIDELESASEAFAVSTVKEVTPVTAVGETTYPVGPVSARLAELFRRRVVQETGWHAD